MLLPVLAAAMACGALLTPAWWPWLLGVSALATALLMRRLDVTAAWAGPVAAIACLPLMSGYAAWRHVPLPVDRWEPWLGERIQLIGRVESAKGEPGRVRAMVTVERGWRPHRLAVEGTVAVQWPALQPPAAGTRWLLDGVIARPKSALLPGLFDRAAWLERQGVSVEMRVGHWAPLASEIGWLERQRLRLVPIFTQGTDGDVGPLAASLVFGVASTPLSPELLQLFRSLNLTHLIAARG